MRCLSSDELLRLYGDPAAFMHDDGLAEGEWKAHILSSFPMPAPLPLSWDKTKSAKVVSCHRAVAAELQRILQRIFAMPEAWESINDWGGCYMWRPNKNNPKVLSRHSWGLAVDLDVHDNPNGVLGVMHPYVVKCFAAEGWVWGGDRRLFPTPDFMHFEKGAV
jgi:hypothetical protein